MSIPTTILRSLLCAAIPFGVAAAVQLPPSAQAALQSYPLASYEQGQSMMQQAISQLKLDVRFKFLDKDYENDQYVRDPITGKKVRVACLRFRTDSGFQFKVDPPQYSLTTQGLTVSQNIAMIRGDALTYKFQPGACAWVGAGFGVQLTDVKVVYKAQPMLSFEDGGCTLAWNSAPNSTNISIGDLNIIGVQNNLDKLAKDAAREAINFTLDTYFGSTLRSELRKVAIGTCGGSTKKR